MIDKISNKYVSVIKVATYFNVFLILVLSICMIHFPYIGIDGGYYLAIGRDVFQTNLNIYEIANYYNPLAILIYSLPYIFNYVIPSQFPILILLIIHFVNALLFYKVLIHFQIKKDLVYLYISIFLISNLLLDGTVIILEPVQVLFMLLASLSLFKNKYFLTGAFVFLAFFSKQYSLALFSGVFFMIILNTISLRRKISSLLLVISGFLMLLIFGYILFATNISVSQYISSLLGLNSLKNFSVNQPYATGVGYNFSIFLKNSMYVIVIIPVIFLWIFLIRRIRLNDKNGFLLGNLFGFSLIFLFAAYFHYYILIVPWSLLLTALLLDISLKNHKLIIAFILPLTLLTSTLFTYKVVKNRRIEYNNEVVVTKYITSVIPKGSKTYIYGGSITQYIYSSLKSANTKYLSYDFPNLYTFNYYYRLMNINSYLIVIKSQYIPEIQRIPNLIKISESGDLIILQKK